MLDRGYFEDHHKKAKIDQEEDNAGGSSPSRVGDADEAGITRPHDSRFSSASVKSPPVVTMRVASLIMLTFSLLHVVLALPEKVYNIGSVVYTFVFSPKILKPF